MRIILASKSPRRKEILEDLGLEFEVVVADADEDCDIKDPDLLVRTIAARKGRAVVDSVSEKEFSDTLLIACDTLVYAEKEFLGKPKDKADAERMIKLLSGKTHQVISGIYLYLNGKEISKSAVTKVTFDKLDHSDIQKYISGKEPFDKAGAYAVQGMASVFIKGIEGDYFNVVGLPVNLLCKTLKEDFGIDVFDISRIK